jgi:hypothetical protein
VSRKLETVLGIVGIFYRDIERIVKIEFVFFHTFDFNGITGVQT